ncbi:hypothetical protein G3567_00235 [Psychroflexus sp. YR1-1]|uniref:CarboxypepD_reg-like domain-containing protein n=1 Tax=Psychroflexus aurantiacus TaxID=2709310 RepID=A0A6B3QWW5_9FLAO|nr:carboxypeptidase-like regulatory domain-containing protein [Psychroflexus aurantiacus]NEV92576.1 hypothetical protein [Psychroflexus aurantiacus]
MDTHENGKFCERCQKDVKDFTSSSRHTILEFVGREQNVCGRFTPDQLKGNYSDTSFKASLFPKLAFIVGIGSILGFSEPIQAKTIIPKTEITVLKKWHSVLPEKDVDSIIIKGTVYDTEGLVLPGVNVILKDTHVGTQTDFDGKFSLTISTQKLKNENYLSFSYVGFEAQDYRFYGQNKQLSITMELGSALMGEGEVVIVRNQSIFKRIGLFFRRLFK